MIFNLQMKIKSLTMMLAVGLLFAIQQVAGSKSLGTLYRWKQMDYQYPTPQHREAAIQTQ